MNAHCLRGVAALLLTACGMGPAVQDAPVTPASQADVAAAADAAEADAVAAAGVVAASDVIAYIDSALVVMRAHAIGRDTVDWAALRDSIHVWAAPAQEIVDAHMGLVIAARRLNPHSFFRPTQESLVRIAQRAERTRPSAPASRPSVASPFEQRSTPQGWLHERDGRSIGRIAIPAFGRPHMTAFADSIEAFVRAYDAADACGWIVDLRGNGGGNMWPMVAGIGPLLGADTLGSFVDQGVTTGTWFYRDGVAGITSNGADQPLARVSGVAHRIEGTPPVAVLFDGGTMSSGEATAIAFIGRPATRSFGVPTSGFTTANQGFAMPDGAMLILTVALEADRTGRVHVGALVPDEHVPIVPDGTPIPAEPPVPDAQLEAALDWLVGQPGCVAT